MDNAEAAYRVIDDRSDTALAELPQYRFADIPLEVLDTLSKADLDALPFGVIGLSPTGAATIYNAAESSYAGLPPARVIGQPFFLAIGVCMNNYLVAQRLDDEPELDVIIDYILTFRMRPTPVKLRLLKGATASQRFILLDR